MKKMLNYLSLHSEGKCISLSLLNLKYAKVPLQVSSNTLSSLFVQASRLKENAKEKKKKCRGMTGDFTQTVFSKKSHFDNFT